VFSWENRRFRLLGYVSLLFRHSHYAEREANPFGAPGPLFARIHEDKVTLVDDWIRHHLKYFSVKAHFLILGESELFYTFAEYEFFIAHGYSGSQGDLNSQ
jgi:hypothetical protein